MITKDMLLTDILKKGDPEKLSDVLIQNGMHCLHCMLAGDETLEQAAMVHGLDADMLVEALNKVIEG